MAFRDREFDAGPSGNLNTKISTQIDGQLPDFIQADHPVFSRFLKHYYQYLEAGELRITSNIDNLLLELETKSYVLDVGGEKIVLENGVGVATGPVNLVDYPGGKFVVGETITGGTSNATATVLVDDLGNTSTPRLFITSQQKFITGETITGGTSNSSGTVTRYRANPVQNIQQLLDYADVDNTIYDFLDNFRDEFMNAIPNKLANGLSKRKLVKNIRELYRAKGTSEGHKIFMRMLLGETANIIYPNKYMMRASDGKWGNRTVMRCSPLSNIDVKEAVGTIINGKTSDATAIIASATSFSEGGAAIVEFELNPDSISTKFTFIEGEKLQATSTVQDIPMTFTLKNIVESGVVTNRSALYTEAQDIDFDTNTSIGNGLATARIENIIPGSVSDIVIDDAGTKFEVGDTLTFTTSDTDTVSAEGFVSVIDGSLVLDGTDTKSTNAGDFLISEDGTVTHIELFSIEMERATASSLGENIILDNAYDATVIQVESGTSSAGNIILNGTDSSKTDDGVKLELEAYHDVAASHAGHSFIMESSINQESKDIYSSGSDRFALEETTDYSGGISRIFLKTGGIGYRTIPTVSISTTTGTSGALLAVTDNIGAVGDVEIVNQGFNYSVAPDMTFPANFTLKDVSGTFAAANTLTTHSGKVQGWNSTTNVLTTTFEDVVRTTLETGATEGIALEHSLRIGSDNRDSTVGINRSIDEDDNIVDADGNRIILNATKTLDEYIVLEGGEDETSGSAIVLESPTDSFFPPLQAEYAARDGTNVGDGIANESGTGDVLLSETAVSLGDNTHARQLERILTEQSQRIPSVLAGEGHYLKTNSAEDTEPSTIILNATDSSQTDAGDDLLNEEDGDKNTIILNGTDSDSADANAKVLMAIEAADGVVALNGTNSDGTNGGDSVIHQSGIDFFDGATGIAPHPTTITDSGGATGTIVKANIAKGTSTIDVTMETLKSYSTHIESLIGEDLNRIQDSYYYQQFSYEVQSNFGTSSYLDQLKKAVHPAGWAVFGKTKVKTNISAAITAAGSSLGSGWFSDLGVTAPADQFSPILASTFQILFSEVTKRRLGVVDIVDGAFEEHIVLEDSEDIKIEGDSIVLNSSEIFEVTIEHGGTDGAGANAGDNIVLNGTDSSSTNAADQLIIEGYSNAGSYVIEETPIFHFDDFAGVQLEDGTDTDAGGYGVIILNGTDSSSTNASDKIISEKSVLVSINIVMDRSEGLTSQPVSPDAGDDILIDGINDSYLLLASSENSYDKILLEAGMSSGYLLSDSNSIARAGEAMELEDASAGIVFNKVGLQGNQVLTSLLNEDGGSQQLETSFKGGGPNHDVSLVTFISRKINLPQSTPRHLSTGLVTFGRNPFPNQVSRFELEKGTATGGYLLVDNDNFQQSLSSTTGHGPDEVIRGEHPIDAGVKFILEDAADPNNDSNFTFENIGNYSNDNIVTETSGDIGFIQVESGVADSGVILLNGTDSDGTSANDQIQLDNSGQNLIVLNGIDSSSTAAGHRIVGESVVQYDFYTLSDIIKPSSIIVEEGVSSNQGIVKPAFFMQEDGSTASGAHGDNIILESKTGFGTNNKLEIESDSSTINIILENYLNSGTIPLQNFTNSTLPPITRPSDILISEYGAIDLEDESNGSLLLNGTDNSSTNAGGRFRFELATDDNININYPNV